jgi:hypothetical protein
MAALNETEVDIQNTKLISYFHKNQWIDYLSKTKIPLFTCLQTDLSTKYKHISQTNNTLLFTLDLQSFTFIHIKSDLVPFNKMVGWIYRTLVIYV